MSAHTAYFATGCFWGADRRFWNLDGVIQTSVGYMGGTIANPTYELVCTGKTGHTESVKILFDSSKISYSQLLKEFWEMHDPTTIDRQGNDIGSQYRSAIFTTSDEQRDDVRKSVDIYQRALDANSIGKIVTEVLPASEHEFFEAEEYHQRYLEKNPNGYDCHSNTGVRFPVTAVNA